MGQPTPATITAEAELQPAWDIAFLFPPQGQWNEADYFGLDESRQSKRLMELADGQIEVLDMPSQRHQAIIAFLYRMLFQFVAAHDLGTVLFAGLRVKLREGLMREPDILFMRKEHDHRRGDLFWLSADLVMEVLSTNRELDLVRKRREYAEAGIPEYWIVDPDAQTITVLTLSVLGRTRYDEHGSFGNDETAQSATLPGFAVSVTEVFSA